MYLNLHESSRETKSDQSSYLIVFVVFRSLTCWRCIHSHGGYICCFSANNINLYLQAELDLHTRDQINNQVLFMNPHLVINPISRVNVSWVHFCKTQRSFKLYVSSGWMFCFTPQTVLKKTLLLTQKHGKVLQMSAGVNAPPSPPSWWVSRSSFNVKLMWNGSKLSVVCRNVHPDSAVGACGDYLCVEGETVWLIDVFQRNRGGNIRRPQDVSEDAFTVRTWSIKYKMWAEFWEDESRGDGHEEIKSREAQLESGV